MIKVIILLLIVLFVVIKLVFSIPSFGAKEIIIDKEKIETAFNYKDGKFFNKEPERINVKTSTIFKFFFGSKKDREPKDEIPVNFLTKEFFKNKTTKTRITWLGHSSVLLEIDEKRILLDPMLSKRASPLPVFGTKRFSKIPIKAEDLPEVDFVVFSHDHYDHLDYKTVKALKNKTKIFLVPLGVGSHLVKWGISREQIVELNWGDSFKLDTVTFIFTPTFHSSGRRLGKMKLTLWGSWVIEGSSKKLFFSADSGYTEYFKEIGTKYGPFDFTMIETRQYNKQWITSHMMPENSVQANIDLQGKAMMPIHWGAFVLALHGWKEPIERAYKEAKVKNVKLVTPIIGKPFVLEQELPTNTWWKDLN